MDDANAPTHRLIGHGFHVHFGVRMLVIIVAGVMAIVWMFYQFVLKNQGRTYHEAKYIVYQMKTEILPLVLASYYTAAILGLIVLAVALICIIYSHRIAGPVYRLEKSIDALGEGDLSVHVKFRDYDALGPIADETNVAIRRLNHKVRSCQDAMELVCKGEEKVAELLRAGEDAGEIRKAVRDIKEGLAELKRATDTVKTGE